MVGNQCRLCIIGFGAMGKEYYKAALRSPVIEEIHIVDEDSTALQTVQAIAAEHADADAMLISTHNELPTIPSEIDILIIATTSAPRFHLLESVLKLSNVKHLLLEKFLFNQLEQYGKAAQIIDSNGINAWVNEWMSSEPSFLLGLDEIDGSKPTSITIEGFNWGLTSNAVHFIELFDYISNRQLMELETAALDSFARSANKNGYYECFGEMTFSSGQNSLKLISKEHKDKHSSGINISIVNGDFLKIESCLFRGRLNSKILKGDGHRVIDEPLCLTAKAFPEHYRNIIKRGECALPGFARSKLHHELIFEPLMEFFSQNALVSENRLPVT